MSNHHRVPKLSSQRLCTSTDRMELNGLDSLFLTSFCGQIKFFIIKADASGHEDENTELFFFVTDNVTGKHLAAVVEGKKPLFSHGNRIITARTVRNRPGRKQERWNDGYRVTCAASGRSV